MKQLTFFGNLLGNLLWKMKYFRYKIKVIPDNPAPGTLGRNIVYVVGSNKFVKWAYLKCPCGCEEIIMLPLSKVQRPSWSVKRDFIGRATIMPSIFKLDGCKSHFWIKKGKVEWT